MHVSGHTATYRNSVSANMNLIGERFFWYRCIIWYRYLVMFLIVLYYRS